MIYVSKSEEIVLVSMCICVLIRTLFMPGDATLDLLLFRINEEAEAPYVKEFRPYEVIREK